MPSRTTVDVLDGRNATSAQYSKPP
jgi:hypothetical protein